MKLTPWMMVLTLVMAASMFEGAEGGVPCPGMAVEVYAALTHAYTVAGVGEESLICLEDAAMEWVPVPRDMVVLLDLAQAYTLGGHFPAASETLDIVLSYVAPDIADAPDVVSVLFNLARDQDVADDNGDNNDAAGSAEDGMGPRPAEIIRRASEERIQGWMEMSLEREANPAEGPHTEEPSTVLEGVAEWVEQILPEGWRKEDWGGLKTHRGLRQRLLVRMADLAGAKFMVEEAVDLAIRSVRVEPDAFDTLFALARHALDAGAYDLAAITVHDRIVCALLDYGCDPEAWPSVVLNATQVVVSDSELAEAWYVLGKAEFRLGNYPRALDAYVGALQADPTDSSLKDNVLDVIYESVYQTIGVDLGAGLGADPNLDDEIRKIVQTLHSYGHSDAALDLLDVVYTLPSGQRPVSHALSLATASSIYAAQNDMDASIAALREAVVVAPHSPVARVNLAAGLKQAGLDSEAYQTFLDALPHVHTLKSIPAGNYEAFGMIAYERKEFLVAAAAFRNASQLLPGNSQLLINCGLSSREGGALIQSLECFRAAFPIDPKNGDLYLEAAKSAEMAGRLRTAALMYYQGINVVSRQQDARLVLTDATPVPPPVIMYSKMRMRLGRVLYQMGQITASLASYELAFTGVDGRSWELGLEYASLLGMQSKWSQAVAVLDRVSRVLVSQDDIALWSALRGLYDGLLTRDWSTRAVGKWMVVGGPSAWNTTSGLYRETLDAVLETQSLQHSIRFHRSNLDALRDQLSNIQDSVAKAETRAAEGDEDAARRMTYLQFALEEVEAAVAGEETVLDVILRRERNLQSRATVYALLATKSLHTHTTSKVGPHDV